MANTRKMNAFNKDVINRMEGDFDESRPVFGIDLGTTNSAVSVITSGEKPTPIRLKNGRFTMPSCVMWKGGRFIVGDEAYRHRECANVVYSVKRHMQSVGKTVKFRDGSKTLEMTPAQVSAKILEGLVEQAGTLYGEIVDVIVTVPAYFDQNGRNATREACELAGLNLIDILNEPTAAALCYDVEDDKVTEFVTFDFGGGTFDATLARVICESGTDGSDDAMDIYGFDDGGEKETGKTIECIAIKGDSHLGGDDIDRDLYKIVCRKLQGMGVDTSLFSREYRESLILRLENLKKSSSVFMHSMNICTDLIRGGVHVEQEVMLSTQDFLDALMPSYRRCKKILDELLYENESHAKKIILVGGSTKNPLLVQQMRRDYPDFEISNALDQDLAVTMGAAVKGKISKFGSDEIRIFDILPMSIGVLDDGHVTPVLVAGSVLPAMDSRNFTTVVDGQEQMRLEVLQGNSPNPDKCVSLGHLVFKGIPKAPAGGISLSVSLTVSAASQLICVGTVNGESQTMNLDLTGETSPSEGMSRDEQLLKRWRRQADSMEDREAGEMLNRLIDGYPDFSSKKDIMQFIKEHREKGLVV